MPKVLIGGNRLPEVQVLEVCSQGKWNQSRLYSEAVAEARRARERYGGSSDPIAFLGYALAKSGKQAEARAVLEELLKLSTQRSVRPYNIALIYNGLNERDETLAWLDRGFTSEMCDWFF